MDTSRPTNLRGEVKLAKLVSDSGFDTSRAISVNGFTLGRTVQTTLQFGKKFCGFIFFTSCKQGDQLFLGSASMIQEKTIDHPAAECATGLFCSRGSVGHKGKECPKPLPLVNL